MLTQTRHCSAFVQPFSLEGIRAVRFQRLHHANAMRSPCDDEAKAAVPEADWNSITLTSGRTVRHTNFLLAFKNGADDEQDSGHEREQAFSLSQPETCPFVGVGERKGSSSAYSFLEFVLPLRSVTFGPLEPLPEGFAQIPCSDDVDRQSQYHHKQRQFRPLALKNGSDRTVDNPIRTDQRIAHLKAVLGEFSRPILELTANLFKRLLRRLVYPVLRDLQ